MSHQSNVPCSVSVEQDVSVDLVKLIRKLRWIGLEDEAQQLALAVSKLPAEARSVITADASGTD